MNPDQQQQPIQPNGQPGQPAPPPIPPQPLPQQNPQPIQATPPAPSYNIEQQQYTSAPQNPSSYTAPTQSYDANYLDSIAPPPPRQKFLSGSFGKIFFVLIGLFVLAVSVIVAFSGKDKTADLQQINVRVTNLGTVAKFQQRYFKSNNLSTTNSQFQAWQATAQKSSEDLLKQAGVKKSQYDKKMVASDKQLTDAMTKKFENARLNVSLDRVYASTMSAELSKLITQYNTMARKSGAKAIREYAKKSSSDLKPIQESFDSYVDDGN